MDRARSEYPFLAATGVVLVALVGIAIGLLLCGQLRADRCLAVNCTPASSTEIRSTSPGIRSASKTTDDPIEDDSEIPPASDFVFADGGGITRQPNGIVDAEVLVDVNDLSSVVESTAVKALTVTLAVSDVECLPGESPEVDMKVFPPKSNPYFLRMNQTATAWTVVFGKSQREQQDIADVCNSKHTISLSVRKRCDGINRGVRFFGHLGCYKNNPRVLGDPGGIIDKPDVASCDATFYGGQTVDLVEVPNWTIGSSNNMGTGQTANGVCLEGDSSRTFSWHTSKQTGNATTQTPTGTIHPGVSMSIKTSDGSYNFDGVPNVCYFVHFWNGHCHYYSDVVAVPPLPGTNQSDPSKLVKHMDLHLPDANCPNPAGSCP